MEWATTFRNFCTKELAHVSCIYANYTMLYAHRYLFSMLANMTLHPSLAVSGGATSGGQARECGCWCVAQRDLRVAGRLRREGVASG